MSAAGRNSGEKLMLVWEMCFPVCWAFTEDASDDGMSVIFCSMRWAFTTSDGFSFSFCLDRDPSLQRIHFLSPLISYLYTCMPPEDVPAFAGPDFAPLPLTIFPSRQPYTRS